MTPEKQARVLIDQHLQDAGWIIQDPNAINLGEGVGIAILLILTGTFDARRPH